MLRKRLSAAIFAALSAFLADLPAASAHTRPSFATNISSAGSKVAIQTTFGLVVGNWTDPSPGTWRWICPDAMGSLDIEDPSTFFLDEDTLLMPGFDGMTLGTNDACDWVPAADALSNVPVFSGARSPNSTEVAFALTSRPSAPNAVYSSVDRGRTWAPTGDELSGAARYDSMVVAPSDASRIYVGGSVVSFDPSVPSQAYVFRSDDGGATWTSTTATMSLGERSFRIHGVDPSNPDRLLASFGSAFSGRLVASDDGGRSFQDVLELPSLDALEWSADGATVVVSGAELGGVWRSNDRGQTFENVRNDLHLLCLHYIGDELWGCGGLEPETQVTRSFDDGETWAPVLTFETDIDVVVPCSADTTVGEVCPAAVAELRDDFDLPPLGGTDAGVGADSGRDAGVSTDVGSPDASASGPPDAGVSNPAPAPNRGSGEGCAATTLPTLLWLALPCLLAIRTRKIKPAAR